MTWGKSNMNMKVWKKKGLTRKPKVYTPSQGFLKNPKTVLIPNKSTWSHATNFLPWNEPNHGPQADMSPELAVQLWPKLEAWAKSRKIRLLGSPSAAGGDKGGLEKSRKIRLLGSPSAAG